jgi:hypothetical protein
MTCEVECQNAFLSIRIIPGIYKTAIYSQRSCCFNCCNRKPKLHFWQTLTNAFATSRSYGYCELFNWPHRNLNHCLLIYDANIGITKIHTIYRRFVVSIVKKTTVELLYILKSYFLLFRYNLICRTPAIWFLLLSAISLFLRELDLIIKDI